MTAENRLHGADGFRPEIQGLRAIAVLVVLVFHIWPGVLTGGYVGVDVFFVISGYLITGLLLRQAESTGRISIPKFYAKRIKRLLPAATLVLVAVGTCVSILPVVRWDDTAMEIAASALYYENWWLAAKAVDYLAAESAPSPLQHFWSLSVEEQYYIVWPVLFAGVGLLGAKFRSRPRLAFGWLLAVIGLGSLAYSVFITPRDPGLAYFATTTRAWELAIGGALAVFSGWERLKEPVRVWLGWLGLAAILVSAWAYSSATPFPGYHALLPTLGSALLIIAGQSSSRWSTYPLLRSTPAQYFGDISYSLYLWHWPVVIFYGQIAGREIGLIDGVIVLAVSTALAHQTKYLVEDYFRSPSFAAPQAWKPFAFATACIGAALLSTAMIRHQVDLRMGSAVASADGSSNHPGALALTDGATFDPAVPFLPATLAAREDKGDAYRDKCIASLTQDVVKECTYGDPTATRLMVVVGDSHAVHWMPALQLIAEQDGWQMIAITKSACPFAIVDDPADATDQTQSCLAWNRAALARVLELKPELVVFAHSVNSMSKLTPDRDRSAKLVADGIVEAWQRLEAAGANVVAIRDTPKFKQEVPDCMASSGATIASCSRPRAEAMVRYDPLVAAAENHPSVRLVDLTDAICSADTCAPVAGNVFVWRDAHHLTASYARSLAPALSRAMVPLVGEVEGVSPRASAGVGGDIRPNPAAAREDNPVVYDRGCHVAHAVVEPVACEFGKADATVHIVLVGDSHAAQWVPALEAVIAERGWRLTSYTKAACAFADADVLLGRGKAAYTACGEWNRNVVAELRRLQPTLVLTSQSTAYFVDGIDDADANHVALAAGIERRWRELEASGIPVVALVDTPRLGLDVPECMSSQRASIEGCSRKSAPLLAKADPLRDAAQATGMPLLDYNRRVCPGETCPPVIDGILVWRDAHHLTATFSASLAPQLGADLDAALPR